uniref:Uncharacterized protein n=1 Tax=Arundo donax TaxID=35708 RepID=A0A0A9EQ11_ARUDO
MLCLVLLHAMQCSAWCCYMLCSMHKTLFTSSLAECRSLIAH